MTCIRTRYLGATNARGARIVASDGRKNRITLNWDDEIDTGPNHERAAQALCVKMNWPWKLAHGWYGSDCYHVFVK